MGQMAGWIFRFHIASAMAFVVALAGAEQASATIITQVVSPTQLNGFFSSTYVLEDFEDSSLEPGVTYSSDTVGTPVALASAAIWAGGVTPSGVRGLITNFRPLDFVHPIIMTFSNPVNSFGLWFGDDDPCCADGMDATLDIFRTIVTNGGVEQFVGAVSLTANMNDFADQFLGFNSQVPITRVALSYNLFPTDKVGLVPYIDNVQFNVISEPSTLTLFLLGFAGLGFALRQRRHARPTTGIAP